MVGGLPLLHTIFEELSSMINQIKNLFLMTMGSHHFLFGSLFSITFSLNNSFLDRSYYDRGLLDFCNNSSRLKDFFNEMLFYNHDWFFNNDSFNVIRIFNVNNFFLKNNLFLGVSEFFLQHLNFFV